MTGRRLLAALCALGALGLLALLLSSHPPASAPAGAGAVRGAGGEASSGGPGVPEGTRASAGATHTPTPELAERTLDRFQRFRSGLAGNRLALGGTELSAVARYALAGLFPAGVVDPTVRLRGGRITATARVVLQEFPALPHLDALQVLLPDTVSVALGGWLGPLDEQHLALTVERVTVAGVPLPGAAIPEVLTALGRQPAEGLGTDALAVPRPRGLLAVAVQRDSLVLVGPAAGQADRAVQEESG